MWKSTAGQDHRSVGRLLRPLLPEDGVALDVGAHGGQVTRLLADLAPRGRVVAVEPSAYARSVLRASLLLRPRPNVVVVAAALGASPGVAVLTTPLKRAGSLGYGLASLAAPGGGGGGPDGHRARAAVREAVPVVTLDGLAEAMALPRLDLVKADVEGHELAVLEGARAALARLSPALYLEVARERLARAGASPEALWRMLVGEMGYAARAVPDPRPDLADGDWLFVRPGGRSA